MPNDIRDVFEYTADGALSRHQTFDRHIQLRDTRLRYDGRGRQVRSVNLSSYGSRDTLVVRHSGLGYVVSSSMSAHGRNIYGTHLRYSGTESFSLDGLGSLRSKETVARTQPVGSSQFSQTASRRGMAYDPQTGRLRAAYHGDLADSLLLAIRSW